MFFELLAILFEVSAISGYPLIDYYIGPLIAGKFQIHLVYRVYPQTLAIDLCSGVSTSGWAWDVLSIKVSDINQ